jgi:hypothetical protein
MDGNIHNTDTRQVVVCFQFKLLTGGKNEKG